MELNKALSARRTNYPTHPPGIARHNKKLPSVILLPNYDFTKNQLAKSFSEKT